MFQGTGRTTAIALLLGASLALAPRPAHAGSSSGYASKTIGNDNAGGTCTTSSYVENDGKRSTYSDERRFAVKVLGRRVDFLKMRTNVVDGLRELTRATLSVQLGPYDVGVDLKARGLTITREVLSVERQLFVGPVPVIVRAAAIATLEVTPTVLRRSGETVVSIRATVGVGGAVTAGVGASFAYVGLKGGLQPLRVTIQTRIDLHDRWTNVDASASLGWSADLSLIAHVGVGWFKVTTTQSIVSGSGTYAYWPIFRATVVASR